MTGGSVAASIEGSFGAVNPFNLKFVLLGEKGESDDSQFLVDSCFWSLEKDIHPVSGANAREGSQKRLNDHSDEC